MQDNFMGRALLPILLTVLVAAACAHAQNQPPQLPPADGRSDGPTETDKRAIEAYVKYWGSMINAADNESDVVKARDAMLEGYDKYAPSAAHQSFYAEASSRAAGQILRVRPARLRQVKEVNTAILFARMPQLSSQDACETMVTHPNSAVRYLGWSAYRAIRMEVLTLERRTSSLMASLRNAAKTEESPIVMEEVFRTLASPALAVAPIPESRMMRVRKELLEIFASCWTRWCKHVHDGSGDAAEACRVGVAALMTSADVMEGDKEARTAILQMLADALWCASKAYQESRAAGAAAEANAALLEFLERGLNLLAGRRQNTIARTLANDRIAPEVKADEVRRHALEWIESLENMDVKDPTDKFKPATTQPSPPPPEPAA